MNVLVDTSIWSLALRRQAGSPAEPEQAAAILALRHLIEEGRVLVLGVIRQELLSGVKRPKDFERLRDTMRAFPDEAITTEDYEEAARLCNVCRHAGIVGSTVDFLICAVAVRRRVPVFSTDQDFSHYSKHMELALYRS